MRLISSKLKERTGLAFLKLVEQDFLLRQPMKFTSVQDLMLNGYLLFRH